MAFTERMEIIPDTPSMITYRHVTHKNGSDTSNGVGSQRGGTGNDAKAEQHQAVNKYDGNSNTAGRHRNSNNVNNRGLHNEVNNQMANQSNHIKFFKTKMCPWHFNGRCTRAAGCSYAHCESELRPVFKTRMCDYIAEGSCPHGGMCIFAHSSEELKPRLNSGDFPRSDVHEQEQLQPKGRQRNTNLTSTPDIQMRENYREEQQRDRTSREYHSHEGPKTKLMAKAKLGGSTYFQQKGKLYNSSSNRPAEDHQRCVSSAPAKNFDSDVAPYEYGRSTSTMDSMSGGALNCDSEKYGSHPVSSPSSVADSAIGTPFSPISQNGPPAALGGADGQADSCSSPGLPSSNNCCRTHVPPHLSLPSPGSSPVTVPAYLGSMGAPSPVTHYWLQYANAAYLASGNDMLQVHPSLFRGDLRNGSINVNGSAQHTRMSLSQQMNHPLPHSNSDIPNTQIPIEQSAHNHVLMQGNFNASVEELNAARPAFYED